MRRSIFAARLFDPSDFGAVPKKRALRRSCASRSAISCCERSMPTRKCFMNSDVPIPMFVV